MSLSMFRPEQPAAEGGRRVHRDLFRWFGALLRRVNFGIVPYDGIIFADLSAADVAAEFDSDGLGNVGGRFDGWQICNGNNGAPDLTSSYVVAAVGGGGSAGTFGTTGTDYANYGLVPLMRLDRS